MATQQLIIAAQVPTIRLQARRVTRTGRAGRVELRTPYLAAPLTIFRPFAMPRPSPSSQSTKASPDLPLVKGHTWHLFLSHIWGTGEDPARTRTLALARTRTLTLSAALTLTLALARTLTPTPTRARPVRHRQAPALPAAARGLHLPRRRRPGEHRQARGVRGWDGGDHDLRLQGLLQVQEQPARGAPNSLTLTLTPHPRPNPCPAAKPKAALKP